MRADMAKIVIEPGRKKYDGRGKRFKPVSKYNLDEDCSYRESMQIPHIMGFSNPSQLDNLNPLYRWLDKQVGRKWDSVYSELCKNLNALPEIHREHIMGHISYHVDYEKKIHRYSWHVLSVVDGILVKNPNTRVRQKQPEKEVTEIKDGDAVYKKINGIWFEFVTEYREVPRGEFKDGIWHFVGFVKEAYTKKRTLNSKELKTLGISNS